MKKTLIVLDFETQKVDVYPYDENLWEAPEEFQDENDCYVITSNCQWMLTDSLSIKMHQLCGKKLKDCFVNTHGFQV